MDPKDFLDFARQLRIDSNAAKRSAVSRAYYAAYHKAHRLLESIGIELVKPREKRETHILTYTCLDRSGNDSLNEAGRLLKDLHSRRIDADYNLDRREVEDEAVVVDCLDAAGEIIAMLEKQYSEDSLKGIKETVENWLNIKYGRQ